MSIKKIEKDEVIKRKITLCHECYCDVCGKRIYSTKEIGNRLQKGNGLKNFYLVRYTNPLGSRKDYYICDNGCIYDFVSDYLDIMAAPIVNQAGLDITKMSEQDWGEWREDDGSVKTEEADFI